MDDDARPMGNADRGCETCLLGRAALPGQCPLKQAARPAGTLFLSAGVASESLFYLREGAVVQSLTSAEGAETVCSVRGSGSLLGIEALAGLPAETDMRALTAVVVCSIRVVVFRTWIGLEHAPRVNAALLLVIDEATRRRDERRALTGPATARIARFLLDRHAEGERALRLKVSMLARVLGMRPETASRALRVLRANGAVMPSSRLAVADIEKLREAAGD